MEMQKWIRFGLPIWSLFIYGITFGVSVFLTIMIVFAELASAADLRVMMTGVGSGTVTGTGINCGAICDTTSTADILLTATPTPTSITLPDGSIIMEASRFLGWEGDCLVLPPPVIPSPSCTVTMSANRSMRAKFGPNSGISTISSPMSSLSGVAPEQIATYLTANQTVTSAV